MENPLYNNGIFGHKMTAPDFGEGLDKVKISAPITRFRDCSPDTGWTVKPCNLGPDTEPQAVALTDFGAVMGERAFLAGGIPHGAGAVQVTVRGGRAYLEFNPSKLHHPWALQGTATLPGILDPVTQALRDAHGLEFDPYAGTLHRLDWARNVETSQPVPQYMPVLSGLRPKWSKSVVSHGATGVRLGSPKRQADFYWKKEERLEAALREGFTKEAMSECPERMLRGEARWGNRRTIEGTGIASTVSEALRQGDEPIAQAYRNHMKERVFRLPKSWAPMPYLPKTARMELLEECRAKWGPRKGRIMSYKVRMHDEVDTLYGGDLQAYEADLVGDGMGERQVRRELADIRRLRELRAKYDDDHGQPSTMLLKFSHDPQP